MNGKSTEYVDLRHLCLNHPFAESSFDIVDPGKPIELLWLMRSYSYILAMSLHPYMSNTFKKIKRSNEYFQNSLYYIYNMHIPCESTVHPVAAFLLLEATPPGDVPPHPAPAPSSGFKAPEQSRCTTSPRRPLSDATGPRGGDARAQKALKTVSVAMGRSSWCQNTINGDLMVI
jgi:hypothetical protein